MTIDPFTYDCAVRLQEDMARQDRIKKLVEIDYYKENVQVSKLEFTLPVKVEKFPLSLTNVYAFAKNCIHSIQP